MFSDLFWALYWIDVLSGIGHAMLGGSVLGIISALITCLVRDLDESGPRLSSVLMGFIPVFVFVTLTAFIPSKQTMYMMLGVRTTDHVVNSDVGKKLQKIIDQEIDGWLKKYEQKK